MDTLLTDQSLIAIIISDNQQAVAVLISCYQDYVFNLSPKILKNKLDAEESRQDSFVKIIKAITAFRVMLLLKSRFFTSYIIPH